MPNRLHGSRALIVGATSHVASAVCHELAQRGVRQIVGTYLEAHKEAGVGLARLEQELKGRGVDFSAIALDQTVSADIEPAVEQAAQRMGGLDLLVTAAARQSERPYLEMPVEEIVAQIAVNLTGTLLVIRAAAKKMIELGTAESAPRHRAIGVVTSLRAIEPLCVGGYDSAKAGLVQHVRAFAKELGPQGISINAVAPGTVDAPIEYQRHGCSPEEYRARWAPLSPLGGKPVTPEIVAEELANLMNSAGVTGEVVCVDGGFGKMRPLPQRITKD